jgi:hypothetical protein
LTEIYYDTEFIDNGKTVRLISIGMVREDGKEYYAINEDPNVVIAASRVPWLRVNVMPYLPLIYRDSEDFIPQWDTGKPDFQNVKTKDRIALDIADFIREVPDPRLWGWFSAYDHLVLSQLYGRMLDMPNGIPQRTNDLAQEAERLKVTLPGMPGIRRHNALEDAREVKYRREWMKK